MAFLSEFIPELREPAAGEQVVKVEQEARDRQTRDPAVAVGLKQIPRRIIKAAEMVDRAS
jgi:hypothetical protein